MIGFDASNAAAAWGTKQTIVTANLGGTFGYQLSGGFGSCNPGSYTHGGIAYIINYIKSSVSDDLIIQFNSTVPRNTFTSILIQDSAGGWRRYETATSTTFSQSGGLTLWGWGTGTNPVFTSASTFAGIMIPLNT